MPDSQKKVDQGWGANEGSAELTGMSIRAHVRIGEWRKCLRGLSKEIEGKELRKAGAGSRSPKWQRYEIAKREGYSADGKAAHKDVADILTCHGQS